MIKIFDNAFREGHRVTLVQIEGTILHEDTCDFVRDIKQTTCDDIVVEIRSTGGDIDAGYTIRAALLSTGRNITTICYGYVASAATIIAQSASLGRRLMSPTGLYLIHECNAQGEEMTVADLEETTAKLRRHNECLAELYASCSGRSERFYATLMAENGGRGRWMDVGEAIEAGLVDCSSDTFIAEPPQPSIWTRLRQAIKIIFGK